MTAEECECEDSGRKSPNYHIFLSSTLEKDTPGTVRPAGDNIDIE